jgi:predicted metal-dependent HD superfamily phosphohydrolase
MDAMTLREIWHWAWCELGAAGSDALLAQLVACYAEPHRHYHTTQHLSECFGHFAEVRHLAAHPAEVALALWFHDAVYQPRRNDNELKSAEWARSSVVSNGLPIDTGARIYDLVMATRHDAVPVGVDADVLVDTDLAVLGASPERFDEYERQVRDEYSWVPGLLYRRERGKVLRAFASRDYIYRTAPFRTAREAQARENIARSLAAL